MKLILCLSAVLIAATLFFDATALAQQKSGTGIPGIWQGALSINTLQLRLVVKVHQKPNGTLTGTLDSVDQGAKDIPIDTLTFKDGAFHFEMPALHASYDGKMNADGSEITGTFTQGAAFPLTFKRAEKAIELHRPQEPKKPYPYDEEEVAYDNSAAPGVHLAGTLTLPRSKGPFPAVLLITGSGPQNRDEELLGHKPFLVLSDYLTRRGIAVLRVDDRGIGKSTGNFATGTTADFATDALAGVAYLKTRKEINPAQIGLIGHSEGGMIAPMVAAQSKDVAFIVLMAGTGVTGEEVLHEQVAAIMKAGGVSDDTVTANSALQAKMIAIVKQEPDNAAAEKKLRALIESETAKLPEAQRKAVGDPAAGAKQLTSPWIRYFLTYDPKTALRKVTCPVLAINGEKDLQVLPKQNLPAISAALMEAGNKDVTILELPGLNHLFQTAKTGSPAEYNQIEETISPLALKTMGDWILKHAK